jgi:hypothetical protein
MTCLCCVMHSSSDYSSTVLINASMTSLKLILFLKPVSPLLLRLRSLFLRHDDHDDYDDYDDHFCSNVNEMNIMSVFSYLLN